MNAADFEGMYTFHALVNDKFKELTNTITQLQQQLATAQQKLIDKAQG